MLVCWLFCFFAMVDGFTRSSPGAAQDGPGMPATFQIDEDGRHGMWDAMPLSVRQQFADQAAAAMADQANAAISASASDGAGRAYIEALQFLNSLPALKRFVESNPRLRNSVANAIAADAEGPAKEQLEMLGITADTACSGDVSSVPALAGCA